ncbi:MAG: RNA polymerase factor sigma-54 [Candidatus Dactylopiibacterium carminicum]|uniref:RNA polymerase sigma-54 factor n=1 Tax=Candidatus Dactylopiibacterium carminicum TaxID=857335 RepID=A0A272EYV8_9RHOO|nr:RNA polymerase factor sigma-54 [Candidatus Dactylopiibacterium carminicum]KAF7600819.1 RNA polymerase factor sigma-54 [Candidatus Dactylopiibacterium carminicum]PAS95318.1 MAG: RNA polymerase factor sigma-54 [Candidatus Dactylopiibacterium carminicum]PAS98670.1 MAG: RNA polymerase factor sigma-54 [Candidatus Dactylopiibacterium carminicum]PAT00825.1 MAG: RNA polymerase factor sigma-54 [Candidatus Dactylopiibacterium carminicum]
MKPSLQLRISQHLALTPQLQQSIRLLQLSTLELNQEIERILLENPMLEREGGEDDDGAVAPVAEAPVALAEEFSGESLPRGDEEHEAPGVTEMPDNISDAYESVSDDDIGEAAEWRNEGSSGSRNNDDEDADFQEFQAATTSLREHLLSQIALMPLTDRDRALVQLVVEALDDDGWLNQALDELLPLIPAEWDVELEELEIALHHVQNLDPVGIGARNLQECLLLQLRGLPEGEVRQLAMGIVDGNLELLAARDFARLKRRLGCNDDALRAAQELVCSLNPRPAAQFADTDTRYVIPDVVVRKVRGAWSASLNPEAMPRLRIHRVYADILQNNRGVSSSLSSQLQEARWLIKNVQQRFDTILRVSQAIVDRQRQFFDHGEVAMRPLTLREIAEELELHESTVSRVTTQKYMATARGVFELKYFFGSHVSTDTGGACSATAIRALIRQLVAAEDSKKPLSDARIAELLGQQGIVVARRTIAKYRESLNIPPVSQRKSI